MNWFKFFSLAKTSKKQPLSKQGRPSQRRLGLEALEERDVPAIPSVVSVMPATGATLGSAISIKFSEDVQANRAFSTGAADPNSYSLFNTTGTAVAIDSVSYDSTTFTATIQASSLNGGVS